MTITALLGKSEILREKYEHSAATNPTVSEMDPPENPNIIAEFVIALGGMHFRDFGWCALLSM